MTLTRRSMLATGAAALANAVVSPPVSAAWEPSEGYPDPRIEALDPRFDRCAVGYSHRFRTRG